MCIINDFGKNMTNLSVCDILLKKICGYIDCNIGEIMSFEKEDTDEKEE